MEGKVDLVFKASLSSNLTILNLPSLHAVVKIDSSQLESVSAEAPLLHRISTMSKCPFLEAQYRGVFPILSPILISAPFTHKRLNV